MFKADSMSGRDIRIRYNCRGGASLPGKEGLFVQHRMERINA